MQLVFITFLQTHLADMVGTGIIHRVQTQQVFVINTANVTNNMRGLLTQRIIPAELCGHFNPPKTMPILRQSRHFNFGQLGTQRHTFEATAIFNRLIKQPQGFFIQNNQLTQLRQGGRHIGDLLGHQFQPIRRAIFCHHHAVTVVNQTTIRRYGH